MDGVRVLLLEDSVLMGELIKDVLLDAGAVAVSSRGCADSPVYSVRICDGQPELLPLRHRHLPLVRKFKIAAELVSACRAAAAR